MASPKVPSNVHPVKPRNAEERKLVRDLPRPEPASVPSKRADHSDRPNDKLKGGA